ncbi:hypothetical protein HWQ46_22205 [Shewanella sp. D64]|uniref:hypothetical protein n=1 Tax=unclassified Shewanella TaxID=196818 RepID=UPI0022BA2661|nr:MULTISPECIES: hypothetical protein [unclassified Shewanella]MEC4728253.1 hypothetical protein [Shewanella sp. D64]MEC4739293.1 hypothetical protein [Shewanella sp. E94]WBJ97047.1 hypothetical protein HWQ47_08050 [Shewanella sp. MTB7]
MKYSLLITALLLVISQTSFAHSDSETLQQINTKATSFICDNLDPISIDVRYDIVRSNGIDGAASIQQIQLIKNQQQVIYKRSPTTFEAWNRLGEYIRYFPQELRSITYRPSDLRSLNINYDLAQQFHLVSPKVKSQLKRGEISQVSCFQVSHYLGQQAGHEILLRWIDSLNLPYEFTLKQGQGNITYRLVEASPITNVEVNALTQGYNDLDFADVGDSESDPFIAKMIIQGFIQHGGLGFYDSNGNSISDGKHHGGHSH